MTQSSLRLDPAVAFVVCLELHSQSLQLSVVVEQFTSSKLLGYSLSLLACLLLCATCMGHMTLASLCQIE